MIIKLIKYKDSQGSSAIEDIKGEVGERPTRSRHCKQGVLLYPESLREENDDLKPGNLP